MGALVVDFFDTDLNQTIGTSRVILKLYLKRERTAGDKFPMLELRGAFPITLTGNPNVKIGEFSISLTTNFGEGGQPERQPISLDESFEQNELRAKKEAEQLMLEKSFPDNRVPASLQRANGGEYAAGKYDNDLDERPIRQAHRPK